MALVEIELLTDTCARLAWYLLSKSPIPVPWLALFGPTRLLSQPFAWQYPDVGVAPPDFVPAPGTIPLRAALTITHVSVSDLTANAAAPGVAAPCTGWLVLTVEPARLLLHLVRLESPGRPPQVFATPLFIVEQPSPLEGLDDVRAAAASLDTAAAIVTLRYAVGANDALLIPPRNLLSATSSEDNWLIRVSGEVFADSVRQQLIAAVNPPPGGTTLEEGPAAVWFQQPPLPFPPLPSSLPPGAWGVFGTFGLEKVDACLDVDLSVDIITTLSVSPDIPNGRVDLGLCVSSDASDWDTFRCWLSTGGIGSVIVGLLGGVVAGIMAAVTSLIMIAEFVRLEASNEVKGAAVGGGFTKTGSDDKSTSYTHNVKLPAFPKGTVNSATVGADGLVVRGSIALGGLTRSIPFQPNGGALESHWSGSYSCRDHRWNTSYAVSSILVVDAAGLPAPTATNPNAIQVLAYSGVTVFSTSEFVHPGGLLAPVTVIGEWVHDAPAGPYSSQIITPRRTTPPPKGERVMFFLHTSAGIRRFDIGPVAAVGGAARPSGLILGLHEANCQKLTRLWTRLQQLEWLVDPPHFDYGLPAVRQWMLTFRALPPQASVTVHTRGKREEVTDRHSFNGAPSGVLELITASDVEVFVEHDLHESDAEVRVTQRWLLPIRSVRLPERADGLSIARTRPGSDPVVIVSAAGRRLALGREGLVEWHGPARNARRERNPLSVSLPNGQVVGIADDALIVAVPLRSGGAGRT